MHEAQGPMPSAPARRWSKRALVLTVVGLVLATAVLTVGMVGFARSIGFVTRIGAASEVLSDARQISPEVTAGGSAPATPGANAAGGAPVPTSSSGGAPAATPPPRALQAVGGAPGNLLPREPEAGGTGGAAGAGGMAGGGAGGGGAGGVAGGGGATQSGWDTFMQTLLGQTTQMCGPNTCNVGQVCCNLSCGICVAPGATCDQTVCAGAARAPTVVRCGSGQCNDGQVCCNPACGICAAPGETCSTESCP